MNTVSRTERGSATRSAPRILILCGGLSPERDVSIRSGRRVAEALRGDGFVVDVRDLDATLLQALVDSPPDCVIPMLHGATGEDGSLADVLTSLRLPYVGATPDAARITFDKAVAKAVARRSGIPTPDSVALPHALFRELGASALLSRLVERLGLPLMVKPNKGGSSLGASVVTDPAELPSALVGAFAYGEVALIEQFVTGTELAVSIVELDGTATAMPAVEIVPDGGFYDYNARYVAGMTEFFAPARVSQAVSDRVTEIALAVHRRFGLRDYSRVDLIVSDTQPWLLEANVAPGMTETSLMPQALQAAGLDLGRVFGQLALASVARGEPAND